MVQWKIKVTKVDLVWYYTLHCTKCKQTYFELQIFQLTSAVNSLHCNGCKRTTKVDASNLYQ